MKILITGGAGSLGASLVDHWREAHELVVVDDLTTGFRESLPADVPFHEVSIVDSSSLDAIFESFEPEIVVHSAASYKDPNDWQTDLAVNGHGAINVATAAVRSGCRRIINFQTALCFGRPAAVPIPANAEYRPFTSYGVSKTTGELILQSMDIPVVSLRLANVTGPRLAIGPIPTFYQRIKAGKGCFCTDSERDFLDMRDFLQLMDRVLDHPEIVGSFNVSTGRGHSIKEIYDAVNRYLGHAGPEDVEIVAVGDDDVPSVVLDPAETESTFGWKAEIGFDQMINDLLAWYDQHGVTAIYSHLSAPTSR